MQPNDIIKTLKRCAGNTHSLPETISDKLIEMADALSDMRILTTDDLQVREILADEAMDDYMKQDLSINAKVYNNLEALRHSIMSVKM